MAIVTAKYRSFISDNYQGGSGKPYEDQVQFVVDYKCEIGGLFIKAEGEILSKTTKVADLTGCENDSEYQLISINIVE